MPLTPDGGALVSVRLTPHSHNGFSIPGGLIPPVLTHGLGRDVVPTLPSDSDIHFPAVEPPAEGPEDAKDEEA